MQPTIVDMPSRKFVGLGTKFISILSPDKKPSADIPQLWHNWQQRSGEIKHRVGGGAYGLVEMIMPPETKSHPNELFYMAAAEVSDTTGQPPGLISRTLPAGKYAKFTHKGKLNTLGDTYNFIFSKWLPSSGMQHRPAADIEAYDHRFKLDSDDSEFDIYIPVQ
jgi:AraC family transcriptional regulator